MSGLLGWKTEFALPKEYNKLISPVFTEDFDFDVKSENGVLTFTLTPTSKAPKIDNIENSTET